MKLLYFTCLYYYYDMPNMHMCMCMCICEAYTHVCIPNGIWQDSHINFMHFKFGNSTAVAIAFLL